VADDNGKDEATKPRTYIETTVVSYLTAWPSRDLIIAAHQQVTRDWWAGSGERFDLFTSELVLLEAGAGDPDAAAERLKALGGLPVLFADEPTRDLARRLLESAAIPDAAADDALHVAIAVANRMDYLVTWNLRHIANARMRPRIDDCCRTTGYSPVIICTPEDLVEA
jgi:hypothetical protein